MYLHLKKVCLMVWYTLVQGWLFCYLGTWSWRQFFVVKQYRTYVKWSSVQTCVQMCVCMCIPNWPFPIGGFQDQCKQAMINIQINITRLRIPTSGRQTSWLFTSVAEKLNSGLPWTTSASGQNGISTLTYRFQIPRSYHSATLPPKIHAPVWSIICYNFAILCV